MLNQLFAMLLVRKQSRCHQCLAELLPLTQESLSSPVIAMYAFCSNFFFIVQLNKCRGISDRSYVV